MELDRLSPPGGGSKKRKRIGRGPGTGQGKTAGKGHKGERARAGRTTVRGFEGGQMPMQRRLPKVGFRNIFRKEYSVVNLKDLERFSEGTVVDPDLLRKERIVRKLLAGVKLLADGAITKPLTIKVHKVSMKAKEKVEAAGGKVEVI